MEKSKGKKIIISLLTLIILALILGLWVYLRLRSAEAYSAPVIINGVSVDLLKCLLMALEVLSGLIMFFFTKSLLGTFDAFLSLIALTTLPAYGIPLNTYEMFPVLSLLLFELVISLIRQHEIKYPGSGIYVIRYAFAGITAGLAVFFLPLSLWMVLISVLVSAYFLIFKRKSAFFIELFLLILFSALSFVLFNYIRVTRTALDPEAVIRGYIDKITFIPGNFYLFCAVTILVVFALDIFTDIIYKLTNRAKNPVSEDTGIKGAENMEPGKEKVDRDLKMRPVSTGTLPEDFVLHRASKAEAGLISSAEGKAPVKSPVKKNEPEPEYGKDKGTKNSKYLEFDIDVPEDDDFDIEVVFN